jgi:outer membrane protein TolC
MTHWSVRMLCWRPLQVALVVGSTLLVASPGTAQPESAESSARPAGRALGLDEALAYARAHQPAVLAARARLRAQQAAARVPTAQWLPRLGATAQLLGATANNTTAVYESTPWVAVPRVGATRTVATGSLRPYASTLAAVGLDQEVFDFGRIATQRAVEDALAEVERDQTDAVRLTIDLGVRETFYAVHAARGVLTAAEQAHERARVHRDYAAAAVHAGLRSPIELTRAEADLTRFDVARVRAGGALADARSAFAAAVGVADLELDVAGGLPAVAPQPPLAEALERAAMRDPTLRAALGRVRAQEALARALGARLRPDLRLLLTFSTREGGAAPSSGSAAHYDGFLPDVPNWSAGFVLAWPIYDGVFLAQRNAAREVTAVRRAEVAVTRQEQVTGVQRADVALSIARTALGGLVRADEAARANYAQADARFKAGLGTSVELADAEGLRTDAEIQLALGRFEVLRARAALGRLMGEE